MSNCKHSRKRKLVLYLPLIVFCALIPAAHVRAQSAAVTVGSASGFPGATVTLPVEFTPGATAVSTLQFDLVFSSPLTYNLTETGAAAAAAGKSVSANPIAGGVRVLIFGLNTTVIGSGVIAGVQFAISAGVGAGTVPVSITSIVASDPAASPAPADGTSGSVVVLAGADTTPPAISGVSSSGLTSSGATIAWTTNEAADTQVEYGTATSYGSSTALSSALSTSHSQALTGLNVSTLYHYRVKSKDAAGNLATSGDYTFTTTAAPDTTPPVISGVASSSVTRSGATISWTTNEAADTQVEYGTTTAYGSSTALNSALSTSHSQAIPGLTAGTQYHYRVKSKDAAGNLATSGDYTFTTTAEQDTTPPVISGVTSSGLTNSGATITWTTNEAADTQVEYGTGTSYGSSTTVNSAPTTAHSQSLTGLSAGRTYHYRVKSKDSAGNQAVSGDYTFTTTEAQDTTPPAISGVASSPTSTGATIKWTTNEPADTQVEYGETTGYGSSTTVNSALATSHSQSLTGLANSTLYHYRVISKDAAGNTAMSGDYTFTTTEPGAAPVISDVTISKVTHKSATISWNTDKPSDSATEYWSANQPSDKSGLGDLVTQHSLTLSNLKNSTQYRFHVKSADAEGNQTVSGEFLFVTEDSGETDLALPRFSSQSAFSQGPQVGEENMIGMAVANLGAQPAALTLTAVDSLGRVVTGPGIVNPKTHTIAPKSQFAMLDMEIFGEGFTSANSGGWVKLTSSSSNVNGFFLTFNGANTLMDGANFGEVPMKDFAFTEIEASGSTHINIANSNPAAAEVTFHLMKANGTVRSVESRLIKANGALVAQLYRDIFYGFEPDPTDYVWMKSTQGMEPFELIHQRVGDVASLTGQDVSAGGTILYSPQYVIGGPWMTRLTVINLESRLGAVGFQFFREDGVQIGETRSMTITARGKLHIDDPNFFLPLGEDQMVAGYVRIISDGVRLAGSTVFGDRNRQSFSSALPLVHHPQHSVLFSHVASNEQYFTGIAIVNPEAVDTNVLIELFDAGGKRIASTTEHIPGLQRSSRVLTEYFPSIKGKDQRSGYVKLTSDQPIMSFALFGTTSLSVLSAIPPQNVQ